MIIISNLDVVSDKWQHALQMDYKEMEQLTGGGNLEQVESLLEMLRHDVKTAEDSAKLDALSVVMRTAVATVINHKEEMVQGELYELLFPIIDPFSFEALRHPIYS